MKTIIAGSRTIDDYDIVELAIKICLLITSEDITEVISGCARGVDKIGERWARENRIPVKKFPANWDVYGKSAGHIRNTLMANYAGMLIAIWDGTSRGTKNMIEVATRKVLKVSEAIVDSNKRITCVKSYVHIHRGKRKLL